MPTIRISNDVADHLKKLAIPLEDTWDSVLRRALGIDTSNGSESGEAGDRTGTGVFVQDHEITVEPFPRRRARRRRRNRVTPAEAYREPILSILNSAGGRSARADVMEELEAAMESSFTEGDWELRSDGAPHWKNRADWMRMQLVNEGVLRKDSDRGTWELA